jgi:hypothetical protein
LDQVAVGSRGAGWPTAVGWDHRRPTCPALLSSFEGAVKAVVLVNKTIEEQDPLWFFEQSKGTLPEVIAASDPQKLNSALSLLFASLSEVRQHYQNAQAEDRRLAICVALSFCCRFIQLFQKPLAEELDVPILHLIDALGGLNHNSVGLILQPTRVEGRPPSSNVHKALKGLAAATVTYLSDNCSFSAKVAHKTVAQWLNKLDVQNTDRTGKQYADHRQMPGQSARVTRVSMEKFEDTDQLPDVVSDRK